MDDIDDIVREFLIESYENLDQLDQDLVALESAPGSRELLSSVFRTIHTIKGTSGFLAFGDLERVAHVGESLLVELRDGRRLMDQHTTDVLLRMVDTIRDLLGRIESTGGEAGIEVDDVIAVIQRALDGEDEVETAPEAAAESTVPEAAAPEVGQPTAEDLAAAAVAAAAPLAAAAASAAADEAVAAVLAATDAQDGDRAVSAAASAAAVTAAVVAAAPTTPVAPAATPAPARPAAPEATESVASRGTSESSIRVDVDLLDDLMRQVGELVLVRNQIAQLAGFDSDAELTRSSQRLSLIASELQEGVMKTRMQPIDHIWSKMPRIVRDLAAACAREVRLEMVGGDTELDRSLLESVKDPLTHLVRNAVDHGIESPATRTASGKPSTGVLTLRAYHAGGQVMVEVRDDGAGIDPQKVAAKALERGLKTAEQLDAMATSDILNLVFLPGFSTAAAVTNVSGRGVGMDVVRSNIESIGGAVEVESEVGRGTTWRLRIPLTLAIMPALTVRSGSEIYAIPQVNLQELVALDTQKTQEAIEHIGSAEVYRLRGSLLPLVRLSDVMGQTRGDGDSAVIAVLQADNQRFGLVVDRVLNNEEIVVKPLAAQLKTIGIYAGATLMGDGQVALILDVQAIARRSLSGEVADLDHRAAVEKTVSAGEVTELLVVGIGSGRRVAVPLAMVTRLELVAQDRLELVGGHEVIQYRDAIVPVSRLARALGSFEEPTEEIPLVVFTRGERTVAMVVSEIVEIVSDAGAERSTVDDIGLLGSIVLSGRVTELLDVPTALLQADPRFYDGDPVHGADGLDQVGATGLGYAHDAEMVGV
ncbi:chemotaxis protein histidine kinase-like protein [Sanguibacter keddieii DSM 10542]|uniref:histidine kinase n=1 Tax=Sanguibacter keddieii (strain ATCC 51767 / DSM 10542 / NCFB 3025 / ST-74) TaxID=446469 RepID=D1BCK9_SANKS|nr:chemotaxis protein CheW [Sanguibacter keddieii]ACZ22996.1 chemotaxis protein histidine kinase-like protein [Sanguibacter keddieii DSM 10542]